MRARGYRLVMISTLCLGVFGCANTLEQGALPDMVQTQDASAVSAEPAPRQGLFARLLGPGPSANPPADPPEDQIVVGDDPSSETAAIVTPEAAERPTRGGILRFLRALPRAQAAPGTDAAAPASLPLRGVPQADYPEVPFGTTVPYGQIARVCGVPNRRLGKVIERYPDRGSAQFRIHDTQPGSTALRTLYLTGFEDGCARQVTAALALFRSFQMHELLRYGLPDKVQPYSQTDDSYEVLKRRTCGARNRRPCGPSSHPFYRSGVFVSIYERFEGNPRWKNLLLYKGRVVAFDVTGP